MKEYLLENFNAELDEGFRIAEREADEESAQREKIDQLVAKKLIEDVGGNIRDLYSVLSSKNIQQGYVNTRYVDGVATLSCDFRDQVDDNIVTIRITLNFVEQSYKVANAFKFLSKEGQLSEGADAIFKTVLEMLKPDLIEKHKATYLAQKIK